VTWVLILRCDGTTADRATVELGQCRGYLPMGDPDRDDAAVLVARANAAGYRVATDGRHLCPDCARGATTTSERTGQ
jgi:hypothetical protein